MNLDFYLGGNGVISYTKGISLTQYSTTYSVKLHTKTSYDIVNMNITTGNQIKTYKKNLVIEPFKDNDGYYVYSYTLGLDVTGYEFQGDQSVIKLAFYLYPDRTRLDMVTTSSICYLTLLASEEGMPSDGSVTESELASLESSINDLGELIADLDIGNIDSATYYNKEDGTKANIEGKLSDITGSISDVETSVTNLASELRTNYVTGDGLEHSLEDYYTQTQSDNRYLKQNTAASTYATKQDIDNLIGGAPENLNTLKEISDWIVANPDISQSIADLSETYYNKSEIGQIVDTLATKSDLATKASVAALNNKQNTLVSGTNIKTVNNTSLLGAGNVAIPVVSATTDNEGSLTSLTIDNQEYNVIDNYITFSPNYPANADYELRSIIVGDDVWRITAAAGSGEVDLSNYATSNEVLNLDNRVDEIEATANEALLKANNTRFNKVFTNSTELNTFIETQPTNPLPLGTILIVKNTSDRYWISAIYDTPVNGKYYEITQFSDNTDLTGYATEAWVSQQGYLTSHQDITGKENLSNKATDFTVIDNIKYPTTSAVNNKISESINAFLQSVDDTYATKASVMTKVDNSTYSSKIESIEGRLTTNENSIGGLQTTTGSQSNRLTAIEDALFDSVSGVSKILTNANAITALNNNKADKATTLAGYGITNAYTKAEVDQAVASVDVSEQLASYATLADLAAETNRSEIAEGGLDSRISTLETAVGTGGSIDTRISNSVNAAVSSLLDGAPEAFDTLKEIADYISEDISGAAIMTTAISENTQAILDETSRATTAESGLSTRITTVETNLASRYSNLQIDNKINTRANLIENNLSVEVNRATNAETAIANDLTAEVNRATNAEGELSDGLTLESNTRSSEDIRILGASKDYTDAEINKVKNGTYVADKANKVLDYSDQTPLEFTRDGTDETQFTISSVDMTGLLSLLNLIGPNEYNS